jgi:RNA polymerase sigma-70 factor (ECF subfamily)
MAALSAASALSEARRKWPDFAVPEERFAAALARAGGDVNVADLYLAQACLCGDRRALAVLEKDVMPKLVPALARVCKGDIGVDDVLQTTREKLLVGNREREPKLAQYTGEGSLVGWLRVVAVRDALAVRRKSTPRKEDLGDAAARIATPSNAHIDLLRKSHAKDFKAAIEEGLAQLSVQDRNMLRMNLLDRMSIDDLAQLYRMHRATAARRLQRARESILEHAQTKLKDELGLSDSEAKSLCGDLIGEIDLTLSRVLGHAAEPEDE